MPGRCQVAPPCVGYCFIERTRGLVPGQQSPSFGHSRQTPTPISASKSACHIDRKEVRPRICRRRFLSENGVPVPVDERCSKDLLACWIQEFRNQLRQQ